MDQLSEETIMKVDGQATNCIINNTKLACVLLVTLTRQMLTKRFVIVLKNGGGGGEDYDLTVDPRE